jgi:hypothetical protein
MPPMPTEDAERQAFTNRFSTAIKRAGLVERQLALTIGITPQALSQIKFGQRPGNEYIDVIARHLNVAVEWLKFGDSDKAPSWASSKIHEGIGSANLPGITTSGQGKRHGISTVGTVVAGDGKLSDHSAYIENPSQPIIMPDTWKAVVVEGMSAYPVVYPGQIVLIDTARAGRPDDDGWNDDVMTDLHDNLVLVETDEPPEIGKATSGKRAYLKRFCVDKRAPDGFVLASIDAGRSSPYVPAAHILMIVPVVAVLFQDPRQPRKKRWHAKTVVATIRPT